jgi:hypothetical protein
MRTGICFQTGAEELPSLFRSIDCQDDGSRTDIAPIFFVFVDAM